MEMSPSKYQDVCLKHANNLEFTMDYDSGYVSHNPESNLDSSSESINAKIGKCILDKPIYLSEDALLEIPEYNRLNNLNLEIDKEDYEETRQLFNSSSTENSTVIMNSAESYEMNYSGFSRGSDSSDIEIPNIKQIIVNKLNITGSPNSESSSNEKCFENFCCEPNDESEECFKGFPPPNNMCSTTAFHNITNTLVSNESKKKLTLIFSKSDKENVYSVKRKYQSMTPDDCMTPEKNTTPTKLEHKHGEHIMTQPRDDEIIEPDNLDFTDLKSKSNNDVSSKFNESSVSVSNHESLYEADFITNVHNYESSFKFRSSLEKYQNKYEIDSYSKDSNLLSECLKNFGETCFINEQMYLEDERDNAKEEDQDEIFITDSSQQNIDRIQGVSPRQRNAHIISEDNLLKNVQDPIINSKNSVEQFFKIIENHDEIKTDTQESMLKQDGENISGCCTVSKELDNTELTISQVQDVSEEIGQTMSNAIVQISVKENAGIQKSSVDNNPNNCHLPNETEENEIVSTEKNVEVFLIPNTNTANGVSSCTTPKKKFRNGLDPNLSPDLFEDEGNEEVAQLSLPPTYIPEERFIIRKDRAILKRAQMNLKGVIPPHSMTVLNISVDEMLNKIEHNNEYFWKKEKLDQNESVSDESNSLNGNSSIQNIVSKSLLLTCSIEDLKEKEFPNILESRCHGLYFNHSKLAEEFEDLCVKYSQRYVGAETQSSCTIFESNCSSPMKRKQIKQRWAVKSPGRRLSHLAKRRITFSSANLQTSSSFAGSRARQILVDAKKLELLNRRKSPRKTPKKTPSKSPRIKTRTPSSSAKKKLALRFRKLTGEIEKTVSISSDVSSKRALFQSPDRDNNASLFLPSTSGIVAIPIDNQKPSTKRALFLSPSKRPSKNSPFKRSPFKRLDLGEERKRKRSDSEDFHPAKFSRSLSMDIRPSGSETKLVNRTKSDMSICYAGELSAVHKKKLQWAVYEALRSQSITASHPQFKCYASILARVTRRFLPNLNSNLSKAEGGTSDRMLRIARHHVYAVLKGKSVDEIYNEYVKTKIKNAKPHGYVGLEEYNIDRREPLRTSSVLNKTVDENLPRKLSGICKASVASESKIDRIRKVINFGDDNR